MTVLVIVESGKKAKTIKSILGDGYQVWACGGHIRHMTTDGLGYDENSYVIDYVIDDKKRSTLNQLKAAIKSKQITKTILASDPDREGEAIAASLYEVLELDKTNYQRVKFNEITKTAIQKAITEAGGIDYDLVAAQETRRILDRAVGWKATAAVSNALDRTTPIGRVQTPAVSLVVERENAIENFVPEPYFNIIADVADVNGNNCKIKLNLKEAGLNIKNGKWSDVNEAKELVAKIQSFEKPVYCADIIETDCQTRPPAPLTTLDMQRIAIQKLGISGKEVDRLAQELYQEGIITYPRTDSTRISDEGYEMVQKYGLSSSMPMSDRKSEYKNGTNAQDAHECIRPTSFSQDVPDALKELSEKHRALYKIIKDRTLMSQMQPKMFTKKEYILKLEMQDRELMFTTIHNETTSAGFSSFGQDVLDEENKDESQNESSVNIAFTKGEEYTIKEVFLEESETKPPSRYTQSSLIKELDRKGIGRPSTFSSIFEKIVEHGYIEEKGDKRKLIPTDFAKEMWSLVRSFKTMELEFTKDMEGRLDNIVSVASEVNSNDKKNVSDILIKDLMLDIQAFKAKSLERKAALIKERLTEFGCLKPECNGKLYWVEKESKKGGIVKLYRCDLCNKWHFVGENQEPIDPDMIDKEWYSEDGNPLFPCPECSSALCKRKGKYNDFWACNSKNKEVGKCSYICNSNEDGTAPSYVKKEKGKLSEYESIICPCCSNSMYIRKTNKGYEFAKCFKCGYMSWVNRNSGLPMLSENYEVYEKKYLIKDGTKEFNVRPRVECGCGAVLKKIKAKDGSFFVRCTGHLARNTKVACNEKALSIDEFDRRFG